MPFNVSNLYNHTVFCVIIGVIECLKASRQPNSRITLCAPTDHFSTSCGDKQWGCGYRNLQMLLSALLKISHFERTTRRGKCILKCTLV